MISFPHAAQLIESKATSLNQAAATFARVEFSPGSLNLDYGGGRFDKASALIEAKGARNAVYDPFNRSLSHNLSARLDVVRRGGADTATVNNVLNVIAEDEALLEAVSQAANGLRAEGSAYFLIYEGDRSGAGKATAKGWQRHEKASAYMDLVSKRFALVRREGNLIVASAPQPSLPSLFDLDSLSAQIVSEARALGVPMPSAKHGAGKLIGGCLYLHKSCWDLLPAPILARTRALLPKGFEPAVAKWEIKTGRVSYIASSRFDADPEPAIEGSVKVFPDGSSSRSGPKSDPQIYHHKWNFVRPGYEGFDYLRSVSRSIAWAEVPCDKSRIGTRSHWESEVVWPHLGGEGASSGSAGPRASIRPLTAKAPRKPS